MSKENERLAGLIHSMCFPSCFFGLSPLCSHYLWSLSYNAILVHVCFFSLLLFFDATLFPLLSHGLRSNPPRTQRRFNTTRSESSVSVNKQQTSTSVSSENNSRAANSLQYMIRAFFSLQWLKIFAFVGQITCILVFFCLFDGSHLSFFLQIRVI